MKRLFYVTILILSCCVLISCKSQEQKAQELVKTELSKTLYDFDSYQPIDVKVSPAKSLPINDSVCRDYAMNYSACYSILLETAQEAQYALDEIDIWKPTSYSNDYTNQKYQDACDNLYYNLEKANYFVNKCNEYHDNILRIASTLDTAKVIGWNVDHTFRCKTKGGNWSIANYRFVVDKKFKHEYFHEDTEADDVENITIIIESILDGTLEKLDTCKLR